MTAVTVAVDCNGADLGPAEVAAGAAAAHRSGGVRSLLFGPAAELERGVTEDGPLPAGAVEIVDAPLSIAKAADPAAAVRANPDSSIVMTARAVADGRAQAFVSGGSTGAALAAGTLIVRRSRGIQRPALALSLPRAQGTPVTLIDVGANTEVRPDHLVQFAFMGAVLAEVVFGVGRPRVALLSNGSERERGRPEIREARATLEQGGDELSFVGAVEGVDLLGDVADVIVCDGFTGNVTLKTAEGVSQELLGLIRAAAMSNARSKAGALLLRPALRGLRQMIDPELQGGAYLLGLRAPAVIPHGRFTRVGFGSAIARAGAAVEGGMVERLHDGLERAGALRSIPGAAAGTEPGDRPDR